MERPINLGKLCFFKFMSPNIIENKMIELKDVENK